MVWRTVVSGLTCDQLVAGAKAKGRDISGWAYELIAKMAVTSSITYRLMVIEGEEFATDEERTLANIRALAKSRGCPNPPAEVALLLAQFTQEELGHGYLVVMHDPISDSDDVPHVLGVSHHGVIRYGWVDAWDAGPARRFHRGFAFVFLAPEGVEA